MKAFLMYQRQDFDAEADPPPLSADLIEDLELRTLCGAMSAGDEFLFDVAQRAMLNSLDDPDAIAYRQPRCATAWPARAVVRGLYDLAVDRGARRAEDLLQPVLPRFTRGHPAPVGGGPAVLHRPAPEPADGRR